MEQSFQLNFCGDGNKILQLSSFESKLAWMGSSSTSFVKSNSWRDLIMACPALQIWRGSFAFCDIWGNHIAGSLETTQLQILMRICQATMDLILLVSFKMRIARTGTSKQSWFIPGMTATVALLSCLQSLNTSWLWSMKFQHTWALHIQFSCSHNPR